MDDQNLTKCRGISKTWFGVTERLQWTRKIQKKTKENKNHQISWKSVLVNIPKEFLKKLVLACEEYYHKNSHWQCSPLNAAVYSGNLQLFKYIYEKSKDKNPKDTSAGKTPFHTAAGHGRLEIFKFIMERAEDKNSKDGHGWTGFIMLPQKDT
jgi:ankyrin repeat protein